ncbi:C40 family peptidase [Lacrimispora algidixylanolytica]|uniref:Hydrolase Nlp/P60 n=1 Tax=Lacrimispora algidixylanolytica TaxID=94868 RepID=A0A419T692_9FIRM|nr:SH3 domain-containing C40 family peptidase [Lacrimispora algidixylanolytica]RKD33127.1 hydrolase Nlp/P60 [Lacrimispora algidixylanolytica]
MKQYGLALMPVVTIWDKPEESKKNKVKETVSAIGDELLYGMGVRITGEPVEGFYPVVTFYNYPGFVRQEDLLLLTLEQMKAYEDSELMVVNGRYVDILSLPRVQGVRLISLPKGTLIKVLEPETEKDGWTMVELLTGESGYIRSQYLREKEFSQSFLWTEILPQIDIVDELAFRQGVMETALEYMGTQYRWGGRSTNGIDCSGLTSESYLLNGILIYRDAKIEEGFPVHQIPTESMLPGDLMYFPGHIAMYLGDGAYIQSTAKIGNSGVVINSLDPASPYYRADLAESWYASGSIF